MEITPFCTEKSRTFFVRAVMMNNSDIPLERKKSKLYYCAWFDHTEQVFLCISPANGNSKPISVTFQSSGYLRFGKTFFLHLACGVVSFCNLGIWPARVVKKVVQSNKHIQWPNFRFSTFSNRTMLNICPMPGCECLPFWRFRSATKSISGIDLKFKCQNCQVEKGDFQENYVGNVFMT